LLAPRRIGRVSGTIEPALAPEGPEPAEWRQLPPRPRQVRMVAHARAVAPGRSVASRLWVVRKGPPKIATWPPPLGEGLPTQQPYNPPAVEAASLSSRFL
jgi:hypothetical protein